MIITHQFNSYTNALIKEFNNSDIEMCINIENKVMKFVPNKYDFKTVREIFKEISLFPMQNGKRISFKHIQPKELLDCINKFKEWASLNDFEWSDDELEWQRLYEMYS